MQKRAIRIVNNVGYLEHTTALFIKSHTLKFRNLVQFKTAQVLYKAKHNLLPGNIQKIFRDREGEYDLRGGWNFKQPIVHTTLTSMCTSVCGVKQWNILTDIKKK